MANQHSKIPNEELFVENCTYKNYSYLKLRVLNDKLIPYVCQICKNEGKWQKKKLSLVLDHINGVKTDNRLSNLRFVCPNCDSQLPTFKSKNIKYQESRNFNLSGYDPSIYFGSSDDKRKKR
tara:strand:+ start:33 stop:398 length:366 start_codon:yes stop_codon:yes gene_type:complete